MEEGSSLLYPFGSDNLVVQDWIQAATFWIAQYFRPLFQVLKWPVASLLREVTEALLAVPPTIFLVLLFFLSWQLAGRKVAIFATVAMCFLGLIGTWQASMVTIGLVTTSAIFCALLGIPIGIVAARSDRFEASIRPVLDVMQTLPAFVYMVPIVMLVGIGNVPGVMVTVIFALPPIIRLTSLGIRNVPASVVEAAHAFGSSPTQVLLKVQIPLAMRTIMAGLNQTLMMVLSMVVYASMISVEGLGQVVLRGIGRLDMGLATVGGVGIVLLAMILDRITQAFGDETRAKIAHADRKPYDFIRSMTGKVFQLLSEETDPTKIRTGGRQ
jgi:glycine betaine/proline transport system permease protein